MLQIIKNIWQDKHSTITGIIGAILVLLGQQVEAGSIDWKGIAAASLSLIIGALTKTKGAKAADDTKKSSGYAK